MYYGYVLCYVDGVLCSSDDLLCTMKGIRSKLKLKGDNIEDPDMYLGADFSNITNVYDQECWDMYSENYCTAAVTNVESVLEKRGLRLPKKCVTPLRCGYHPEIDVTGDLKVEEV